MKANITAKEDYDNWIINSTINYTLKAVALTGICSGGDFQRRKDKCMVVGGYFVCLGRD